MAPLVELLRPTLKLIRDCFRKLSAFKANLTYQKNCISTAIVCLIFVWACSSLTRAHTQGQGDYHVMSHVHVPGHQHDYSETFSNPPGSVERNLSWESLWFFPSRPFAQLFDQEVPEDFVIESDDAIAQSRMPRVKIV